MKFFGTLGVLIVLAGIGMSGYVYFGFYNVSARQPHSGLVSWFLGSVSDNSVARHAAGIVPPPLEDPAMVREGAVHYRSSCIPCHGGPGVERSDIGKGLYPPPPHLERSVRNARASDLFWIVQNGVKDTGMPAFEPSYSKDQIWSLVAFLRRLPSISPEEYRNMLGEEQAK